MLTLGQEKGRKIFALASAPSSHRMGEGTWANALCGDSGADFGAPFFDFGFDGFADFAGAGEFLIVATLESGRVGKTPMQAGGDARKDWAALRAGLVANGNDVGEALAGFVHVEHGFGLVARNVYADLLHCFDNDGIQFARFKPGAVSVELVSADLIEERLGHLAASAIVDTDKQDFLFHG
jgi:hypothetical protein